MCPQLKTLMDLSRFKKILVIRTDRIGDVLLSTPVLFNLRKAFPQAHLAIMVTPYARDIVYGNPNINEVIIYDKRGLHKGWFATIEFAIAVAKKRFDLALVLHPTNRAHIVSFLAGIKHRIGYDKKFSFLLTYKLPDNKFKGKKHERDYALDLLIHLGLDVEKVMPFMPIRQDSEVQVERLFKVEGIDVSRDKLVAIHPGASCPSKRWPIDYFAKTARTLIKEKTVKIAIIGASENAQTARRLAGLIDSSSVIDFTGRTSVSQLASVLKRSNLFISNDSGPVHIASSLNTPVIAIFGRNQRGLSPKRWGPLGQRDRIVYKDVGCQLCLAHNCNKDFLCLKSIKPEEICELARSFL